MKIEVCVGSATEAFEAQRCGADRVELCAALGEGGLTPSWGEITTARKLLTSTALNVIIRPRRGDFLYSAIEVDSMVADIEAASSIGADGVVIGCLTADGDVDMAAMQRLVAAAGSMSITFHRAFDMCRSQGDALQQIIDLGCDRVLTSGGKATAELGVQQLKLLVEQAADRIIVMPGCGINADNVLHIVGATGAREVHFSANRLVDSAMRYRNAAVSMGGDGSVDEFAIPQIDAGKIKAIRGKVESL